MTKETKSERTTRHELWRKRHAERQVAAAEALADFWLELTRDCDGDVNSMQLRDWNKLLEAGSDYFWSRYHIIENGKEQS